ncbi:MAG: hypothetical protein IID31_11170, partial [Planctomycetes bacterium]|nr:hypothetical protein [Planctomycetota bacterium]
MKVLAWVLGGIAAVAVAVLGVMFARKPVQSAPASAPAGPRRSKLFLKALLLSRRKTESGSSSITERESDGRRQGVRDIDLTDPQGSITDALAVNFTQIEAKQCCRRKFKKSARRLGCGTIFTR